MNIPAPSAATKSDPGHRGNGLLAAKENKRQSESHHPLLKSTSSLSTTSSTASALSSFTTSSLSSGSNCLTKHANKLDQPLLENATSISVRSTRDKFRSKLTPETTTPSLNRRTILRTGDDDYPTEIRDSSLSQENLGRRERLETHQAKRIPGQNSHDEGALEASSVNSIAPSNNDVTCSDDNNTFCTNKVVIDDSIRSKNISTKETDLGGSEKESLLQTGKDKFPPNISTQNRNKRGAEIEIQLSSTSHHLSRVISCTSSLASSPSSHHSPPTNSSYSSCDPSHTNTTSSPISPPKFNRQKMFPSLPFQMSPPPPTFRGNTSKTDRINDDYSETGLSRYNDIDVRSRHNSHLNSGGKPPSMVPVAANTAALVAATTARQDQQRLKYKMQEKQLMQVLKGKRNNKEKETQSYSMSTYSTNDSKSNSENSQSFDSEHDFEMIIHPQSVPGTTEAAAWHLHGQTGGRTPKPGIHPRNGNSAVMDTSTMERTRMIQDDGNVFEMEYNDVKDRKAKACHTADTGVTVTDLEGGMTTVTADTPAQFDDHSDMWSTGVATAVAMGAVSRYKKALCMFPHGRRVLLPIMMGILAFALSMITSVSCQFMTIIPSQKNHQVFQVGPWRYLSVYNDYETCLPYPSDIELDSFFMIARSASALASCFGGGLVLWTCTLTCLPHTQHSLSGLGIFFFITSFLELFTVLFFQSENCKGKREFDDYGNALGGGYFGGIQCKANQDLVFCIAASILYFATGVILYLAQKFISGPGFSTSEVYTWSAELGSSNRKKGILRTVEKCWAQLPDGSRVMATVLVEKRRGKDGKTKTTHSIQTEILPA